MKWADHLHAHTHVHTHTCKHTHTHTRANTHTHTHAQGARSPGLCDGRHQGRTEAALLEGLDRLGRVEPRDRHLQLVAEGSHLKGQRCQRGPGEALHLLLGVRRVSGILAQQPGSRHPAAFKPSRAQGLLSTSARAPALTSSPSMANTSGLSS